MKKLFMDLCLRNSMKPIIAIALLFEVSSAFSFNLKGHPSMQLGGYWSSQGKAQHINILDTIGDDFSVSTRQDSNVAVGAGYFIDGAEKTSFQLSYGINIFYLAKTSVSGYVTQENLFTNLSYSYDVSHLPLLAVAKATINTQSPQYAFTVDLGIGPNFMRTSSFSEQAIDGISIPEYPFSVHTTTTFSAMTGIGVKLNNLIGPTPLECGYKFFYLGQGHFSNNNSQVTNTLNTGNDYAHAVMCSITV